MDDGKRKRIIDLVDKVFIINLPHRLDRRAEMQQELESAGWIDPEKVVWYPAFDPKSATGFDSPGVRGCFTSHLGVINAAKNLGCRTIMIIEDDCDLSACNPAIEAELYDRLQGGGFAMCMLGHSLPHHPERPLVYSEQRDVGIGLTHCYLVNSEVFTEMCRFLEAILLKRPGAAGLGPMHVDGAFNHFRSESGCVTWVVNPPVANQRSSRSDVTLKWFDKIPMVSDLAQVARKVKRSLTSAKP